MRHYNEDFVKPHEKRLVRRIVCAMKYKQFLKG